MKTNNITYRRVGNYNIPNPVLPHEEANIVLAKWGMLYKDYLLKNKKALFTTLLAQGKLSRLECFAILLVFLFLRLTSSAGGAQLRRLFLHVYS